MRTSRLLAAAAFSAVLLAVPSVAVAATYPPAQSDITASDPTPTVGDEVTVTATGYQADSDVDVTTRTGGSAAGVAGSSGTGFRGAAAMPAAAGGCETGATCTVVADGTGTATASISILEAGPTTVTFSGTGADGEALVQSVVLDAQAADEGSDPSDPDIEDDPSGFLGDTGAGNLLQTGVVALVLLGIGTVLVLALRRRRDGAHAA